MSTEPATDRGPAQAALRTPRRGRRLLLACLAVLLLLAAALWLALPRIVERRLVDALAAAGFPDARLTVADISFGKATIADLRLDAEGTIAAREIVAEYEPLGLLDGRVERITVRDPHIVAGVGEAGLTAGGVELPGGGGAGPLSIALPPVTIDNGRIDLTTPVGTIVVPVSGEIRPGAEGGTEARLGFRVDHRAAALAGTLHATLADAGTVEGRVTISEGTLRLNDAMAAAINGSVRFTAADAQPLALTAELDLSGIAVGPARFPTGKLTAALDVAASTAKLLFTAKDPGSAIELDAALAGLRQAPRLAAHLDVAAAPQAWLWPALALPPPSAGTANFSLRLNGPLPAADRLSAPPTGPAAMVALLAESGVEGRASLDLRTMAWPDFATAIEAKGVVDLRPSEGGVLADISMEGSANPAASLLDALALPDALRSQIEAPLAFRLASPLSLRPLAERKELFVSGNASLDLGAGGGAAEGDLLGHLRLSDALVPLSYHLESGEVTASGLATPYGRLDALTAALSLDGRGSSAAGRFSSTARLTGFRASGFSAGAAGLALDTSYRFAGGMLTVSLGDGGKVTLEQFAGPLLAGRVKTLRLPLVASDAPLLEAKLVGGHLSSVQADLRLGRMDASLPLALGGGGPLATALTLPGARVAGVWDRHAGHSGIVEFSDGSLSLPRMSVAAGGVAARIELGAGDRPLEADIRVARLAHGGKSPTLVPVALTATAELADGRLAFRGRLADSQKRLVVTLDGSHAMDSGKGRARLAMQPLVFAPGALQPRALLPRLARDAEDVAGTVGLGGTVSWAGSRVSSDLRLLLENLSLKLPQLEIVKLNTVVAVDSLLPFTTRPAQQVAVGLIEVGIPLTDGLVTFDVDAGPKLRIEAARLSLAGGEVTVPPVTLDPSAKGNDVRLRVKDVDLGQLLALASIDGLSATGKLSGRIPVRIEDEGIVIRDGVLQAAEPGVLRYAPGEAPAALQGGGETVEMAMAALSNFHYTDLRITLDRDAGGETVAVMQVKGSNPDFYGGYPVEFNLNVSGQLDQILDRGLAGYRVPETIQRRLQEFRQRASDR